MQTTSARLLSLLAMLQARRDWPGALLVERLGVSHRTVRRDIERLRELGYPIRAIKGPDGGYRLDAGTELPPLLFDDEQAVALVIALQTVAATGAGVGEAALRALSTVRQVLPARLARRVDTLHVTAIHDPRTNPPVDPAVLVTLSDVIRAREVIRFDYSGVVASGATEPDLAGARRRVEPHHLVSRNGRWYLVAWDLDRDDWRTFRADRIIPRANTGPRFTPRELPGGDVAAFVTARFRGSTGSAGWPCHGVAILDLPAHVVSSYVSDGIIEPLGPHRSRLTIGSWSWPALATNLGRFDTSIEVVEPAELRHAFALLAHRYAAAANDDGSRHPTTSPPP